MLNDVTISKLIGRGFKRWTKGSLDRLYVNASQLGLVCDYYNTGNIKHAEFNGQMISNCQARRYKAAKTFIDVNTEVVHSDIITLEDKAKEILDGILKEGDGHEAVESYGQSM